MAKAKMNQTETDDVSTDDVSTTAAGDTTDTNDASTDGAPTDAPVDSESALLLAQAITLITVIEDPVERTLAASALLTSLLESIVEVKGIRQQAVQGLHRGDPDNAVPGRGYGWIADKIGLSRGRVQQIVNDFASGKPAHRDQTKRREIKALIAAGSTIKQAAAAVKVNLATAERLVGGTGRPPGRPKRVHND